MVSDMDALFAARVKSKTGEPTWVNVVGQERPEFRTALESRVARQPRSSPCDFDPPRGKSLPLILNNVIRVYVADQSTDKLSGEVRDALLV